MAFLKGLVLAIGIMALMFVGVAALDYIDERLPGATWNEACPITSVMWTDRDYSSAEVQCPSSTTPFSVKWHQFMVPVKPKETLTCQVTQHVIPVFTWFTYRSAVSEGRFGCAGPKMATN